MLLECAHFAHCSLLAAHCSLLAAHCSLLTSHCSLLLTALPSAMCLTLPRTPCGTIISQPNDPLRRPCNHDAAYYDYVYRAPLCNSLTYACNSTLMLDSRGTYSSQTGGLSPPEDHDGVNTVFDSCTDGRR